MKAYITKYALTEGIQEVDGIVSSNGMWIRVEYSDGIKHIFKPHWHRTKESAIEGAEEMRLNKLTSLANQIAKLKKLEFK